MPHHELWLPKCRKQAVLRPCTLVGPDCTLGNLQSIGRFLTVTPYPLVH